MNFKRFQMNNVRVPDDILFVYGSRSVRADVIKDVLQNFSMTKGQVYTRNTYDKDYYKDFLPFAYIATTVNKEGIAYLFKKQTVRETPAFLILDNCFEHSADFIANVCQKAKKYNVLVIVSCNRGSTFPAEIASLASCVILAGNTNKYDRKDLFTSFGDMFSKESIFFKCFDYLTEDDNLMIICKGDNDKTNDDLQNQVFWYPLGESKNTTKNETKETVTNKKNASEIATTKIEERSDQNDNDHHRDDHHKGDHYQDDHHKGDHYQGDHYQGDHKDDHKDDDHQTHNQNPQDEIDALKQTDEREERGDCCLM